MIRFITSMQRMRDTRSGESGEELETSFVSCRAAAKSAAKTFSLNIHSITRAKGCNRIYAARDEVFIALSTATVDLFAKMTRSSLNVVRQVAAKSRA